MVRWVGFLSALILGTGCESLKSILGLDHKGPNEFGVMPLAPLSLPSADHKTPSQEKEEGAEKKQEPKADEKKPEEAGQVTKEVKEVSQEVEEPHAVAPATQEAQKAAALLLDAKEIPLEKEAAPQEGQKVSKEEPSQPVEEKKPEKLTTQKTTQEQPSPGLKSLEQKKPAVAVQQSQVHKVAKAAPKPAIQVDSAPAPELVDPPSCQKNYKAVDEDEVEHWVPGEKDLNEKLPPSTWEGVSEADRRQAQPKLDEVAAVQKEATALTPEVGPQTPKIRLELEERRLAEVSPSKEALTRPAVAKEPLGKAKELKKALGAPAQPQMKASLKLCKMEAPSALKVATTSPVSTSASTAVGRPRLRSTVRPAVRRRLARRRVLRKKSVRVVKKNYSTKAKRRRLPRRRLVKVVTVKAPSASPTTSAS